ncbi:FkbM family methyltransferase [Candidatus Saccharibacteria bacterium]|nr:FkbM family methyltransferase [Candidatus Saccharibacteria bacterium]
MKNFINKSLRSTRDKFFKAALTHLDKRIDVIERTQVATRDTVNSIYRKQINSGIIQLSEKEILTKIFTGLKMYLDPRDLSVATHIALDGVWEEPITKAWISLINENDTVLDIGANFGYFGLLAAQFTSKKNSKVVMFEANPEIVPYVKKSLKTNWFNEQAKIENFAISDKEGTLTLNVLEGYIGSSSVQTMEQLDSYMSKKMQLNLHKSIKVPAISIDQYCKVNKIKSLNLIKMDIEGSEEMAYKGMRQMIKVSPNVSMFIEFTSEAYSDPRGFYSQMLEDFGSVYLIDNDGSLLKPSNTTYEYIVAQSDDWVMPVFSKNSSLHIKK